MFLIPKKSIFKRLHGSLLKIPKERWKTQEGKAATLNWASSDIYLYLFDIRYIFLFLFIRYISILAQRIYLYLYIIYKHGRSQENLCALDTWISFSTVIVLVLMLIAAANHNWQLGLLTDRFTFIIVLHWLSKPEMRFWMCKSLLLLHRFWTALKLKFNFPDSQKKWIFSN